MEKSFVVGRFWRSKAGFTLIELLVVVLIIGILAAVALPTYQKAVIKSRYNALKPITVSLVEAQELYYLTNGQYATKFSDLDIEVPGNQLSKSTDNVAWYDWGYCKLESKTIFCRNMSSAASASIYYQVYYQHVGAVSGRRRCIAEGSDVNSIQNQICKKETHRQTSSENGTTFFAYNY